jgi:hypothetical protein
MIRPTCIYIAILKKSIFWVTTRKTKYNIKTKCQYDLAKFIYICHPEDMNINLYKIDTFLINDFGLC